ncbi:MAG: arylamine N-acetyltransferase [Thermomicrobiales bacterium]|nr:arylamine N-acetyltransferase [Thermomicrobiales bacterium]
MLDVSAYLARIGYDGPVAPTLSVLQDLHLAHLRRVPFENLDIHLGRPVSLAEEDLYAKVVQRRRGGFCYELNGLLAALLREMGYEVTLLAAQFPLPDGRDPIEFDHLVLRVAAPGMAAVLADVAGGRNGFVSPLAIGCDTVQAQPAAGASFRLQLEEPDLWLWRQGPAEEWERVYRFTWKPRQLTDFEEGCRYHQTSPDSGFTRKRICTLLTDDGRVTLADDLLITTRNGHRHEERLTGDAWQAALDTHFGIDLTTERLFEEA